MAELESIQNN